MVSIEFGSRESANMTRSKVEQYLSRTDDRRELSVRLKSSAPDRIVERVKQAAFESREQRSRGAGKANITDKEQKSLNRQHSNFNWRDHGFEAMAVKAAMQAEGVTEWMDYYEPGEGTDSALAKLRSRKGNAQGSRASVGVGGKRTDAEEMGNMGRRSSQAERARSEQTKQAKGPALVETDTEAIEFLREEQQFGADPFDVSITGSGPGLEATGRDMELLEQRNQKRSEKARLMDDLQAAEITKDPIAWAQNPSQLDFPGIDTLEPEKVHARRSERARDVDNDELAPIADTRKQWANAPDEYDWPGVDTPSRDVQNMNASVDSDIPNDLVDDRALQDSLGFAGDATEARESRLEAEKSGGGIMEDTRSNPGRGVEKNDTDGGEQAGLSDMDAMKIGKEVSDSMNDVDKDLRDMDL